jgi:hypothetical protein
MIGRRHYEPLARIVGWTLGAAYLTGGETTRAAVYDTLYRTLVVHLAAGDAGFDVGRFAYAVGIAANEQRESERVGRVTR